MKKFLTLPILALILFSQFSVALAARPNIIPAGTEPLVIPSTSGSAGYQESTLTGKILPSITQTVIALSAALAVLFIIVGGITILTAYGKTEKIESGKKTIIWAITGLLISILSYAIVSIINAISLPTS